MLYAQVHLTLPAWLHEFDTQRDFSSAEGKVQFAIDLALANITHGSGGPFGAAIFDQLVYPGQHTCCRCKKWVMDRPKMADLHPQ